MKNGQLIWTMLTDPRSSFRELRQSPRFWLPISLGVLASAVVLVYYYQHVDFQWYVDHVVSSNARTNIGASDTQPLPRNLLSRSAALWSALIGVLMSVVGMRVFEAFYYALAGRLTKLNYSFKHWLSLSCWANLPLLIGILASLVFVLVRDISHVGYEDLQLLSLNALFFHAVPGSIGFLILSNTTLLHPWIWLLAILAVKDWSGRSTLFAATFVLLRVVFMYSVWAFASLAAA